MSLTRTLLITGGHGFVAGAIITQASSSWTVNVLSRSAPPTPSASSPAAEAIARIQWHRQDILDAPALAIFLQRLRPNVIIHTAAIADIDFCEAHPEAARAVNVEYTRTLTAWCCTSGARLVFCSTDNIFDGERAPYREEDPPDPINCYAKTKVEAEDLVRTLGPNGVIARLSLVIGLPFLGAGNSILARIMENLRLGREIRMPTREVRTPLDLRTAARALLELAGSPSPSILHLAGHSRLNRFDMTRQIAACLGLPGDRILPTDSAAAPGRAPRPRDVSLDNARSVACLQTPMLTFAQGLEMIQPLGSVP